MTIVQRIQQLTEDKNWSDYRLAREANLSQSTISNLLSRGSYPSLYTLENICSALGMSLTSFFIGCEVDDADTVRDLEQVIDSLMTMESPDRKRVLDYIATIQALPPQHACEGN